MDDATVERRIDLDAPPEEVWDAFGAPETWLADAGSLPLEPGAEGHLVEDGRSRTAVVEEVAPGERLVYRWWDDDAPGLRDGLGQPEDGASRVEITLLGVDGGTRVTVREWAITSVLDARGVVVAGDAWGSRFTWLSLGASSRVLVGA